MATRGKRGEDKVIAGRLKHLDGLRGLAILLVIGFHAFARWPDAMPYGDRFERIPLFTYGWVGVELFFLISGYVILMTLEKCRSHAEFLVRRWRRLFPAMCVCSLLLYATAGFFQERPAGMPTLASLLPGLTFTEPAWWRPLLGFEPVPLEGAFWSLFVEFKFYVIAALLYFRWGTVRLILCLWALYVFSMVVHASALTSDSHALTRLDTLCRSHLSLQYFGWFAAGAAYFVYARTQSWRWFHAATAMALTSALFISDLAMGPAKAAFCVAMVFALSMVSPWWQAKLSGRVLLFIGMISYPLYLLHENAMVASIVKLAKVAPDLPQVLLPVLPLLCLAAVAYALCMHVEKPVDVLIKRAGLLFVTTLRLR